MTTNATKRITNLAMLVTAALLLSAIPAVGATPLDPAASISDVYAFRSYGPSATTPKVTLILNVDPLLEPAQGPRYFPFDPDVLYQINVDNNNDAAADVIFQFRFSAPQYDLPTVPLGLIGAGNGFNSPISGTPVIPPGITTLTDQGLNSRQTYTVTMVKNGISTQLTNPDGSPFFVVPDNIGPRTMPNYPLLYAAGTYTSLSVSGVSVFAGMVDDPFFMDMGGTYDTFNFRVAAGGGVLSPAADADDHTNIAPDTVSGYAVNGIAIEVPVTLLTSTGNLEAATSKAATIGVWGTTSRQQETFRTTIGASSSGPFIQVQREGNPLLQELTIGMGSKDTYSLSQPANDSQFSRFLLNPPLATFFNAIYGIFPPVAPRTDLLPLYRYLPPVAPSGTPAGPIADMLRLNTGIAPTPVPSARRLGLLAGDLAGYPNGRRLFDDVVDITFRIVGGGALAGNACGENHNQPCNFNLGDGVNTNDVPFNSDFPYLGEAPSGRNRRHIDPGEPGCTQGAGAACPVN